MGRLTRRMVERKERPLSPAAVLHVAHEVLRALEYAHGKRDGSGVPLEIVHRDVSPENILVSARGEVKLLDFGIAKVKGGRSASCGAWKGNLDFVAPEQAAGGLVDRRADLFSVGLVIYFCAVRAPLYRGKSFEDRLVRAATGPGPEELEFIAGLPPPLPELVSRVLSAEPGLRCPTAAAFRELVAPHVAGGAEELGALVRRLFAEELAAEQARFGAAAEQRRGRSPGRSARLETH
jgi:eukaryotic-like serine/threonine-protein kinase